MYTRKENSNPHFYFSSQSSHNSFSEESKLLNNHQPNSIRSMQNSSIENKLNMMGISDESSQPISSGPFKRLKNAFHDLFRESPLESRTIHINKDGHRPSDDFSGLFSKPKFPMNIIRNQRYTMFTFLPYVLFEQFRRFSNLYFLFVCLSQLIPPFSVGYMFTYVFPLSFVLAITICKEAYDDWYRYKRDQEANSQKYRKLTKEKLVDIPSSELMVGDIVYIEKNQRIPADLIFLKTSESSGSAFIRTDQLDGETDWKLRVAVPISQKLDSIMSIFELGVSIHVEPPSKDIHEFSGTISFSFDGSTESLSVENTLWMNTVLASGNAFGVVIFTGEHTRAVMNTSQSSTKLGLIDEELNTFSKLLFVISFGLSLLMISMKSFFGPWPVYLVRFFILFSSIIPISMRVNVDTARLVYSHQISNDKKSQNIVVRNSSIPEELGRVGYLLSDKTGTLTQNDMELKRLHLGTMFFSQDSFQGIPNHLQAILTEEGSSTQHSPPPSFYSQSQSSSSASSSYIRRGRRDLSSRVFDLVQALALCHNVTPTIETSVTGEEHISYQASSPDEIAIVKWTSNIGVTLYYRDREKIGIKRGPSQELREFYVLEIFPFTSELKRMGIIVKDSQTNEIFFYMKGADIVMSGVVQRNDWLEEECGNMAREGLRTLVIARKKLSEEQLIAFQSSYARAKLSIQDRSGAIRSVISSLLEVDLELLGITGVEDRLQEDVKITLEILRNAGIKVWMLTGDKVETATCIAISSKLIARNQLIFQVQKLSSKLEASNVLSMLSTSKKDSAFVIDGPSLQLIMDTYPKEFLEHATLLTAVICCRCTPTQKADIARLIKTFTKKRVCCIGDGGNDVSMIQAADIGVGIVGKEGMQASLAADFSLQRFCDISRLIMWHGRNSYKRTAKLSQFVIHRGLVISVLQAVFSSLFYFVPIALYQGLIAVGYATVFTNWSVFSMVLDHDVKEEIAMMYPELYKELTKGRSLCFRTVFSWILISLYQGGIIMMLALWLFETDFIHIVSITFTALLLNELLMVALQINTWHFLMVLAELVSVSIYLFALLILDHDFDVQFMGSLAFLWKVSLITVISFLPLFIIKSLRRVLNPPNYVKVS